MHHVSLRVFLFGLTIGPAYVCAQNVRLCCSGRTDSSISTHQLFANQLICKCQPANQPCVDYVFTAFDPAFRDVYNKVLTAFQNLVLENAEGQWACCYYAHLINKYPISPQVVGEGESLCASVFHYRCFPSRDVLEAWDAVARQSVVPVRECWPPQASLKPSDNAYGPFSERQMIRAGCTIRNMPSPFKDLPEGCFSREIIGQSVTWYSAVKSRWTDTLQECNPTQVRCANCFGQWTCNYSGTMFQQQDLDQNLDLMDGLAEVSINDRFYVATEKVARLLAVDPGTVQVFATELTKCTCDGDTAPIRNCAYQAAGPGRGCCACAATLSNAPGCPKESWPCSCERNVLRLFPTQPPSPPRCKYTRQNFPESIRSLCFPDDCKP